MDFLAYLADPRQYCGVEIPRVIEWMVCIIILSFAVIALIFFRLVQRNHSDLKGAQHLLQKQDVRLTKQQLDDLSSDFSRIRRLLPMWREYRNTLVPERSGDNAAFVFSTVPAEQIFTFWRLVDQPVAVSIYMAVPGILTSLGLLGTFLALFVGLISLKVDATGQVFGIQGFITGLSGKFVSSILGLFLAIVSLITVRKSIAYLHDEAGALQSILNHTFERKTQESILIEMLRQLEDQSAAYKSFSADLAGQIKSSFHEDISDLASTMSSSLTLLNQNISEQGNSFKSFAEAFSNTLRESLKEGLQPGIEAVQQSLGTLSQATEELRTQKAESSQDMMEKLLGKFQQSLTGTAGSEFSKLGEVLSDSAKFSQQMNAQIKEFLVEMKLVMESQQAGMNQQRSALETSITRMLENFDALSTGQLQGMQQQLNTVVEQTEQWTNRFRTTLDANTEQQAAQYGRFVDGVAKAQGDYLNASNLNMNSILNSVKSHTSDVETSVVRIVERVDASSQALNSLLSGVSISVKEFDDLISKNSTLAAQLKLVADSLQSTSKQAEDASRLLNASSSHNAQASEQLVESLHSTVEVFTRMQQILKDHNDLYSILDNKLGKATEQISTAISTYNRATSEGLNKHLSDFDNALTSACNRLGETVESIEGPIDELAEVITKATSGLAR